MSGNTIFSQIARRILMQELGVERASDQMALAVCTVYRTFLVQLSVLLGQEGASMESNIGLGLSSRRLGLRGAREWFRDQEPFRPLTCVQTSRE